MRWIALLLLAVQTPSLSAQSDDQRARAVSEYLIPEAEEVALALSAGPPNVTAEAAVLVLRPGGYERVRDGTNGFACLVQRGWSSPLVPGTAPDFFDPRLRAPICYNPAAAISIMPEYLRRTELALAGRSAAEMRESLLREIGSGALRPPAGPAIAYMLSGGQWIGARVERWHPHVMLYLPFADQSVIGAHDLESGLPLAFDYMGTAFATFVIEAKDFVMPEPTVEAGR